MVKPRIVLTRVSFGRPLTRAIVNYSYADFVQRIDVRKKRADSYEKRCAPYGATLHEQSNHRDA
jgi:hypothetical protein